MIPSSRIHRGFHRLGAVLAALVLLLDVVAAVSGTIKSALPLIGVALAFYAAARALGWIIVGFIGSDRP